MGSPLLLILALSSTPAAPVPPAAPTVEVPAAPVGHSTVTPTAAPAAASTPVASKRGDLGPSPAPQGSGASASPSPPPAPPQAHPPAAAPAEHAGAVPKHTPRSLSGAALADELRDASRRRQGELSAIRSEREKLEKLREEIEASRKALREETARLDERIKAAQEAPPPPAKGAPAKDGKVPVDALAKTLKGMRPEQAAGVVARLDKPLAVELLRRMRPGDAAALLERMKPEAAADLFVQLAGAHR